METRIGLIKDPVEQFFAFMHERHSIYLRRQAGMERPWTNDWILNKYKFTHVFRNLDRTSQWYIHNVREKLDGKPELLLATTVFRWFTRAEIGDSIFTKEVTFNRTPWDNFLESGDGKELERVIRFRHPKGPHVTGAYLLTSKFGMDKLAGMCSTCEDFYHYKDDNGVGWEKMGEFLLSHRGEIGLKDFWFWLKKVPFQGPFTAYEVAMDLRYSKMLDLAPDVNTFSNPGPGARAGLARMKGLPVKEKTQVPNALQEMIKLLELSRDTKYWPNDEKYPPLELHQIEFVLCEYAKYVRTYLGEGKPRSLYK